MKPYLRVSIPLHTRPHVLLAGSRLVALTSMQDVDSWKRMLVAAPVPVAQPMAVGAEDAIIRFQATSPNTS